MLLDMWRGGWFGRSLLLLLLILVVLAPLSIVAAVQERRQWEAFKVSNNCRVVGTMTGDVFTTVGPAIGGGGGVSIGVGATPGKTGWACDNGMTYWR